jgi:phage shock protein E
MNKNYFYITVLVIVFIAVIYYTSSTYIPDEINPEEARKNIKQGKYDYIVDVRTEREWNEEHLPNTISIPIGELVSKIPEKIPDKNANILFICKKGIRASGVVKIAHKLGYKNVQAMIGSYKELNYT